MKQIVVAMEPFQSSQNTYISIVKNNMPDNIEVVPLPLLKDLLKTRINFDIAHLNWYEKIDGNTIKARFVDFLKKYIKLTYLKHKGVKLVVTFHNKFPHDCNCPRLTTILIKKMVTIADGITILCNESYSAIEDMVGERVYEKIKQKIVKIPHPNYIGVYPDSKENIREKYNISNNQFVVLFFGAIKPYKNIELVIESAKAFEKQKNVTFIIAGGASNQEYKREIENKIKNFSNIIPILEFVPDEKLVALINSCDVLLLPYNLKSSLNSGTCILAFSLAKNVICPCIGTIKELSNDVVYSYKYEKDEDQLKEIIISINKAYQDFHNKKIVFEKAQEDLYEEMITINNPKEIGKKYNQLYRAVIGRKETNEFKTKTKTK